LCRAVFSMLFFFAAPLWRCHTRRTCLSAAAGDALASAELVDPALWALEARLFSVDGCRRRLSLAACCEGCRPRFTDGSLLVNRIPFLSLTFFPPLRISVSFQSLIFPDCVFYERFELELTESRYFCLNFFLDASFFFPAARPHYLGADYGQARAAPPRFPSLVEQELVSQNFPFASALT